VVLVVTGTVVVFAGFVVFTVAVVVVFAGFVVLVVVVVVAGFDINLFYFINY
jgi:hypothetical protein